MAHHTSRAGRRAGRILVGLAAVAALAALVVAVPLVLLLAWRVLGPPVPSLRELSGPDDGTLFVRVLCLVGWLAWATFTWSVLAEILAQWRGWHVPALGWQRRMAAGLVASIAIMLSPPAIASATATPVHASPAIAAPRVAAPDTTAAPASGPRHTEAATHIEHIVQPGEQMPALAERYLGDKYQWHAIAAATYGIQQPDGRTLSSGDTRVYPGWTVRIPAAAAAANLTPIADTTTQPATAEVYKVSRGDRLWSIAERFLGDPERYPEIAALNPGLEEHDHRFPDHIEATWELTLPADARDAGPRTHATGTVIVPAPPPATPAPPPATPAPPPATPAPSPTASAPPSASPTATPSVTASPSGGATSSPSATPTSAAVTSASAAAPAGGATPAPTADHGQDSDDDSAFDNAILIGAPLFSAGLLAALLLTTLRRRRRRQEQHRPPGRRIPEPVKPKAETELRVVAQPIAVDRLDQALRVLGVALIDRPSEQMPDVVGVWLHGEAVNLLLTGPCPNPPAPWIGDQLSWTLPGDVPLPDVDGQLAPLPTLVAVGSQPGMHLMLDLERLGLLTITGDRDRGGDLLRYLAVELSCNAWSDHVEVTVAGFDAAETGELIALGGDRIDAAASIGAAIERIRRRASQVVRSLDHLGAGDPLTGRVADIAADAWMPHVLLAKNPNPAEIAALEALDSDLAATGRCAVAVAVTADREVGRWPVSIDATGRLSIAFLGMTGVDASLNAAGLPRSELAKLAELLNTARQGTVDARRSGPADSAVVEDWPRVPAAPETEQWAQGADAAGALIGEPSPDPVEDQDEDHDPTDDEAPAALAEPAKGEPHVPAVIAVATPLPELPQPRLPADASADNDRAARVPVVVAAADRHPARKRVTAPVRRRHSDPTLDADIRAWTDADPSRPRIAILGPVTVEAPGQLPDGRLRFYAEIITYLAQRGERGATTDQFYEALWPEQQVKPTSRRVAVARARRWLGETPEGEAWLPDATRDRRYRMTEGYLLDWHLFRRLRSRGESRGPAGLGDLRQALTLVRGAPLAGADVAYSSVARNPYAWLPASDIQPHHLASAVVDTAHQLVELCLDGGDITGARWAVDQAWLADPDRASDIAWRDLLRVANAEGKSAELDELLGELMRARDAEVPEDLDKETYRLLCELMPERMRAGVR